MAKMMNEQTAKTVKDALTREAPYRMVDGGLCLLVNPNPAGSKPWRLKHKGSLLALGAYPAMTLTQARAFRDAAKLPCIPGIPDAPKDTSLTFRVAAVEWHAEQTHWSDTNRRIVARLLEDCVYPQIGDTQMGQITKTMTFERVVKPFEGRGVIPIGLSADLIDGLGDPGTAGEGGKPSGFVT